MNQIEDSAEYDRRLKNDVELVLRYAKHHGGDAPGYVAFVLRARDIAATLASETGATRRNDDAYRLIEQTKAEMQSDSSDRRQEQSSDSLGRAHPPLNAHVKRGGRGEPMPYHWPDDYAEPLVEDGRARLDALWDEYWRVREELNMAHHVPTPSR